MFFYPNIQRSFCSYYIRATALARYLVYSALLCVSVWLAGLVFVRWFLGEFCEPKMVFTLYLFAIHFIFSERILVHGMLIVACFSLSSVFTCFCLFLRRSKTLPVLIDLGGFHTTEGCFWIFWSINEVFELHRARALFTKTLRMTYLVVLGWLHAKLKSIFGILMSKCDCLFCKLEHLGRVIGFFFLVFNGKFDGGLSLVDAR